MIVLGIAIGKNKVFYSVIDGESKENCTIKNKGVINFQCESKTLMTDFSNIFNELISKFQPNSIGYKLFLDSKKEQIKYMVYSFGVLELICEGKNIKTTGRTINWIKSSKKKKISAYMSKFGNCRETPELYASVIAWNEFGE